MCYEKTKTHFSHFSPIPAIPLNMTNLEMKHKVSGKKSFLFLIRSMRKIQSLMHHPLPLMP